MTYKTHYKDDLKGAKYNFPHNVSSCKVVLQTLRILPLLLMGHVEKDFIRTICKRRRAK